MDQPFDLEEEMTGIVMEWIRDLGYTAWAEAPLGCDGNNPPYADIAGARLITERCEQRLEDGPVTPWGSPAKCEVRLIETIPDWYPLFERTVAIELKLNDWQGVITQAYNNMEAAMHSYVAMPRPRAEWVMDQLGKRPTEVDKGYVVVQDHHAPIGVLAVDEDGVEALRDPIDVNLWRVERVVNLAERAWSHWRKEGDNDD